MFHEILTQRLMHGHRQDHWIVRALESADHVERLASALAARERVLRVVLNRSTVHFHFAQARAHGRLGRERHPHARRARAPAARELPGIAREDEIELTLEVHVELFARDPALLHSRVERENRPEIALGNRPRGERRRVTEAIAKAHVGATYLAHGISDEVVRRRLEDVVAEERRLALADDLVGARAIRGERVVDELLHAGILRVVGRANRDQLELVPRDATLVADGDVEAPEERAHRSGLDHDDFAFEDRALGALVRVTRKDHVELRDLARNLPRHREPSVRDRNDEIGALRRSERFHEVAQAVHPRRIEPHHFVRRLPLRRRGIGDSDEGDANAVLFERHLGREETLPGLGVVEVVRGDLA